MLTSILLQYLMFDYMGDTINSEVVAFHVITIPMGNQTQNDNDRLIGGSFIAMVALKTNINSIYTL